MVKRKRNASGRFPQKTKHTASDFGAFYPVGYVVAAFPRTAQAKRVRKDLLTGGYDERDVIYLDAKAMARSLRSNLDKTGLLARLGTTRQTLEQQLAEADKGCDFLLVHAPSDEETARVMKVARRVPYRLAHRFHRLAIEDLD